MARIIVADRGDPIPPDIADQMFEPFFTTGPGDTSQPGSIGLGLAVSRRLAGLMNGTLRYERSERQNRFLLEPPREGAREQVA
jgi:two-component system sensor histidine kinase ChiS